MDFVDDEIDDDLFLQASGMLSEEITHASNQPKFTVPGYNSQARKPPSKSFVFQSKRPNALPNPKLQYPQLRMGTTPNLSHNHKITPPPQTSTGNSINQVFKTLQSQVTSKARSITNQTQPVPNSSTQNPQNVSLSIVSSNSHVNTPTRNTIRPKATSNTKTVQISLPKKTVVRNTPPKVDPFCCKDWLYPINLPKRDYQYQMVKTSLYNNTMICLPTGLGKTFIAGVVMYNYYRWFPEGKIIFLAPTKPLVEQQEDAFRRYVPIQSENITILTGRTKVENRKQIWKSKRVFFCTPQILENDLKKGTFDGLDIVCLVLDEAHRAQGEYAYCAVVKAVSEVTKYFRIVALSASPGSDKKSVQKVLDALKISKMEVRTDDSDDIQQYRHSLTTDVITIPASDEIVELSQLLMTVLEEPITWLFNQKVIFESDPRKNSQYKLLKIKEKLRSAHHKNTSLQPAIEGKLSVCMSLYSIHQALNSHGIATFASRLQDFREKAATGSRARQHVVHSPDFIRLQTRVQKLMRNTNMISKHPKFQKIREIIQNHFEEAENPLKTRVMIFCTYKDAVMQIVELISSLPNVLPKEFIGQNSKDRGGNRMSQKEQQQVVAQFRVGVYNTLVCTSIGEEGLDIGEVDLIICFDTQTSPTRNIQRTGRTGRKRDGRCVILLTEGSEVATYRSSLSKKKSIFKKLAENLNNFRYYTRDLPMVPTSVPREPKYIKDDDEEEDEENDTNMNDGDDELGDVDLLLDLENSKNENSHSNQVEEEVTDVKNNVMNHRLLERFNARFYISETPVYHISHSKRTKMLLDSFSMFPPREEEAVEQDIPVGDVEQEHVNEIMNNDVIFIDSDEEILDDEAFAFVEEVEASSVVQPPKRIRNEKEFSLDEPPRKETRTEGTSSISHHVTKENTTTDSISAFSKWSYKKQTKSPPVVQKPSSEDIEIPSDDEMNQWMGEESHQSLFSPIRGVTVAISPIKPNLRRQPKIMEPSPVLELENPDESTIQNFRIAQKDTADDMDDEETCVNDPLSDLFPSPVTPVWVGKSLLSANSFITNETQSSSKPLVPPPPQNDCSEDNDDEDEEDSFLIPQKISIFDSSEDFEDIPGVISPKKSLQRLKRANQCKSPPRLPQPEIIGRKGQHVQKRPVVRCKRTPSPRKYFFDREAGCRSDDSSDEEEEDSCNLSFVVSQSTPDKGVNMRAIYHYSMLSEASQQQVKQIRQTLKSKSKSKEKKKEENNIKIRGNAICSPSPPQSVVHMSHSTDDWFGGVEDDDLMDMEEIPETTCNYSHLLSNSPQTFFREISSSSSST